MACHVTRLRKAEWTGNLTSGHADRRLTPSLAQACDVISCYLGIYKGQTLPLKAFALHDSHFYRRQAAIPRQQYKYSIPTLRFWLAIKVHKLSSLSYGVSIVTSDNYSSLEYELRNRRWEYRLSRKSPCMSDLIWVTTASLVGLDPHP